MKKTIYGYCIPPIDIWAGWNTLKDYVLQLIAHQEDNDWPYYMENELVEFMNYWKYIQVLAKQLGWEGDFGPIYISALPDSGAGNWSKLVIAFKQCNNGTTFVFSQVPLDYLSRDSDCETAVIEAS